MRLSWNEMRVRAAKFAQEWRDASYEKGETQSFYNEFFEIFDVRRRSVARYEAHVEKLDNRHGFIDLFWPGVLLVEQKSAGRDLARARDQAFEYFDALPERDKPRYLLVSDFQTFELADLDEDETVSFSLSELPERVQAFGFIVGVQRRTFRDQDPANIEAAEIVGRLHDALHAARYRGHDLERLLVRLVFCLFADDTGIFEPRDIFLDFLENRTRPDGTDLGALLSQLFQVLDTKEADRSPQLDEDLTRFPYVNGDLFQGALRIPAFDAAMRDTLLDACRFDWSHISPAIFGALFQSVMNPHERRAQGAHYTTEKNILKVIEPLFLDDLRTELARLKARKGRGRRNALLRFQDRLAELRLFDPACGCGNFLIIAYRELRLLEMEVIREIDGLAFSRIDVDQFYGIEIGEFPVRIAETALWMMDHIMNNRLSIELGEAYVRIPPREIAAHRPRGRSEDRLDRRPRCRAMLIRAGESAIHRREVPDPRAASGGRADYRNRKPRQHARLRYRMVREGRQLREREPQYPDRLRGNELNHPRRTSRATLAGAVQPLPRNRICAPHLRLGLRRTGQGPCPRRHPGT